PDDALLALLEDAGPEHERHYRHWLGVLEAHAIVRRERAMVTGPPGLDAVFPQPLAVLDRLDELGRSVSYRDIGDWTPLTERLMTAGFRAPFVPGAPELPATSLEAGRWHDWSAAGA